MDEGERKRLKIVPSTPGSHPLFFQIMDLKEDSPAIKTSAKREEKKESWHLAL